MLSIQEKGISRETVDMFIKLLIRISDSELVVDCLRNTISSTKTKVDEFYRDLNSNRNGRLTISELENGLQNYSDMLSPIQVTLLFYRLCQNKQSYLLFDQFERFCYSGEQGRIQFLKSSSAIDGRNNSYYQEKRGDALLQASGIFNTSNFNNSIGFGKSIVMNNSINNVISTNQHLRRRNKEQSKLIEQMFRNAKLEGEIEQMQRYLITKRDLKLYNLFEQFKPQNNYIDLYQFGDTLKILFKINVKDISDVALLFRKVKSATSQQQEIIDFQELCSFIIPRDSRPSRELLQKDKSVELDLYSETLQFLTKLFKAHLNNEVIFNDLRLALDQSEVTIQDLFDCLAKGKNYLEKSQFDQSLKEYGSPYSTHFHNLSFLRFDQKQEGIINFSNFAMALRLL